MPLPIKSSRDIEEMRRAGALLWSLLESSLTEIRAGLTTEHLAKRFEERLLAAGAEPVMRIAGFPAAMSVCINEEAVHGVPGPRIVREGDIVTIDAAIRLDGWCADAARCAVVGQRERALCTAARSVMDAAIAAMNPGGRWSHVVSAAHAAAVGLGATILPFEGHGIGRMIHEPPAAGFAGLLGPGSGNRTPDGQDFILRPGLVLTVEPVVTLGRPGVRVLDDGWTEVMLDRSDAAHEERTVAVTRGGALILTAP